jgi:ADP-heptose:LPS heptosyltransferase
LTHAYPKSKAVVHFADDYIQLLAYYCGKPLKPNSFKFSYEQLLPWKMPEGQNLVFNAHAAGALRTMPVEKAVSIIQTIQDNFNFNIIMVGTPGDRDHVDEILEGISDVQGIYNWAGRTDLLQLAMVLKKADLVISVDTGSAHLANAYHTKLIVIFNSADPRRTRPFNTENLIVLKKRDLECWPCHPATKCRRGELLCFTKLDTAQIKMAIQNQIDGDCFPMIRDI